MLANQKGWLPACTSSGRLPLTAPVEGGVTKDLPAFIRQLLEQALAHRDACPGTHGRVEHTEERGFDVGSQTLERGPVSRSTYLTPSRSSTAGPTFPSNTTSRRLKRSKKSRRLA